MIGKYPKVESKSVIMKEKLIKELEEYFGPDAKRINHAKQVMNYADELLRLEGGDWHIVIPASILHDVGIKAAEKKYGSSAGHFQEKEGPKIARIILLKLGFNLSDIDEICQIIAHHHSPGKINTPNFKIIYDSDWLVNLKDEVDLKDKEKVKVLINKVFFTQSAKEIAQKKYL
jgi:HD superfamily phosphodiesterase